MSDKQATHGRVLHQHGHEGAVLVFVADLQRADVILQLGAAFGARPGEVDARDGGYDDGLQL